MATNGRHLGEPWALEAQASIEAAEAALAAARAEPTADAAPAFEEVEVAPLEGPEPWEAEADAAGSDLPPPPTLPVTEVPAGDAPPPPPAADGTPAPGTPGIAIVRC